MTTTSRAWRRPRGVDDTGSLPMAMLLTLVGVALSALLIPVVLTQINATGDGIRRGHSLGAAQAGLDVALGHIRAAVDATGAGVFANLPCGPLDGRVGSAGTARYRVTIDYLAADPIGQTDAWIAENRIDCVPGAGPASPPGYALLRSRGTDQPTGDLDDVPVRTLSATYPFRTVSQPAGGGLIRVYRTASSLDLCLDAGSGTPAAGTNLLVQPCDPASDQQRFLYNPNLTLVLAASKTASAPLGMCLDAGSPQSAGGVVQLQQCSLTTRPQQQWIFNEYGNFEGTADGATLSGLCFNVQVPDLAGSFVVLGSVGESTCRQPYDIRETFMPEPTIGSGAAGSWAGQVVSFGEFGRCLAVTDQDVDAGYLIAAACQQSPDSTAVHWSQRWTLPAMTSGTARATGPVSTETPGGRFCLRSPGTPDAGRYVTVTACAAGAVPPDQTWTVYANTDTFPTSYRVEDGFGYCLAPTDPAAVPPDLHPAGQQISKIVVDRCDSDPLQKWNVPADTLQTPPLENVTEW